MTDTTDQRSPEEIERDIPATQAEMNQTVRQIENEFTPRNIIDAMLDKAGQNGVDSSYLIDTARRNPLALGMIAIGGLWLVSGADARPSALKMYSGKSKTKSSEASTSDDWHPDHRSYVEHLSRCERQPGEDDISYRRRRDHSRASYFMLEQGHDEDEGAFRMRLDAATETMRRSRERMAERAQAFAGQTRDRSQRALEDARGFYTDNPLLGGIAAAFVGAVVGSVLPATHAEEDTIGGLGEQALGAAGAKARQGKDAMLDRMDEQLASGSAESGRDRQTSFSD